MHELASYSGAVGTDDRDGDGLVVGPTTTWKCVMLSGQNLKRGAVLGRVTASSKVRLSLSAASDGSQTPDRILAEDCDATSGDKECFTYVAGSLAGNRCTFGAGHTFESARVALRNKGIDLQTSLPA